MDVTQKSPCEQRPHRSRACLWELLRSCTGPHAHPSSSTGSTDPLPAAERPLPSCRPSSARLRLWTPWITRQPRRSTSRDRPSATGRLLRALPPRQRRRGLKGLRSPCWRLGLEAPLAHTLIQVRWVNEPHTPLARSCQRDPVKPAFGRVLLGRVPELVTAGRAGPRPTPRPAGRPPGLLPGRVSRAPVYISSSLPLPQCRGRLRKHRKITRQRSPRALPSWSEECRDEDASLPSVWLAALGFLAPRASNPVSGLAARPCWEQAGPAWQ